jgi:large conductance mechanosensitive channel
MNLTLEASEQRVKTRGWSLAPHARVRRPWRAVGSASVARNLNAEGVMLDEFKKFLLQTNALALAIGVVIGAAIGKVVSSIVTDLIMPVVGLAMPGGTWREMSFVLTRKPDGSPANAITYGAFLGNVVDFLIVAMAVFLITKALLKPAPAGAPSTKECSECKEIIPIAARKCRACASPQPA